MRYELRSTWGLKGNVPAEVIAEELEALASPESGLVDPEVALVAVSSPTHRLHPILEWDDRVAAHEHRLTQIRSLCRAVVRVGDDGIREPVFVHVQTEEGERGYAIARVAVREVNLLASALGGLSDKVESLAQSLGEVQRMAVAQRPDPVLLQQLQRFERIITDLRNVAESFGQYATPVTSPVPVAKRA